MSSRPPITSAVICAGLTLLLAVAAAMAEPHLPTPPARHSALTMYALIMVHPPADAATADDAATWMQFAAELAHDRDLLRGVLENKTVQETSWYGKESAIDGELCIGSLRELVRVEQVPGTNLVRIGAARRPADESERAELAAIVNTVAGAMVEQSGKLVNERRIERIRQLDAARTSLNDQLQSIAAAIARQVRTTPVPVLEERDNALTRELDALAQQIVALQIRQRGAQADLSALQESEEAGQASSQPVALDAVAADPVLARLDMLRLEARLPDEGEADEARLKTIEELMYYRRKEVTQRAIERHRAHLQAERDRTAAQLREASERREAVFRQVRDLAETFLNVGQLQRQRQRLEERLDEMGREIQTSRAAVADPLQLPAVLLLPARP